MKKKYKVRKFEKLMHPHYPIGWGTGLTAEEWRKFAEEYNALLN